MKERDQKEKIGLKGKEWTFWALLGGVSLWLVLYLYVTPYDLSPDEAYYWTWSKRLAWGYYSKPPLVALIIWATTSLGGDTPFFVRLGAPLLWTITAFALYRLSQGLLGPKSAIRAFLLGLFTLWTPLGGFLMTIDPPLMAFWGLTLLFLFRALQGNRPYWYLGGVTLGLGLLSKYTMALLPLAFFLYLLSYRSQRPWLKRKEPYLFLLIAFIFFFPHLLWEWRHGLIAFKHTASLVSKKGEDLRHLWEFLGGQALLLTPLTFLLVQLGSAFGLKKALLGDERYGFLLFPYLFPFGICLLLSLKGPCYANWPAPAYLSGLIMAQAALEDLGLRPKVREILYRTALGVGALFLALSYSLEAFKPLLPKGVNPTSKVTGWKELGAEVMSLMTSFEKEPFLLSPDRKIASELAFYAKAFPRTYAFNPSKVPSSQFDLWGGLEGEKGENAIVVLKEGKELPQALREAFESCKLYKDFYVFQGGERTVGFRIFVCHNLQGDL